MPFQVEAICPNCGYKSKRLEFMDGIHLVATCNDCRKIVNPRVEYFTFVRIRCTDCRRPLKTRNPGIFHSMYDIHCPTCGYAEVNLETLAHSLVDRIPEVPSPALDARVQGRYMGYGGVEFPGFPWRTRERAAKELQLLEGGRKRRRREGIALRLEKELKELSEPRPNEEFSGKLLTDFPQLAFGSAIECRVAENSPPVLLLDFLRELDAWDIE